MTPFAIDAHGLRVIYGATVALRGVTLQAEWGRRVALLGANGAGKSTLLRVLTGALRPDGGSLKVGDTDALANRAKARSAIGVVAHRTLLYEQLTAVENLEFFATLYDVHRPRSRALELLAMAGLAHKADTRTEFLSRGQQQRLTVARALLHDPAILMLDEPETGLDLAAFDMLAGLLAVNRTLVLATHNLALAGRLCDRYLLLAEGRPVSYGTMPAVRDLEALVRSSSSSTPPGAR